MAWRLEGTHYVACCAVQALQDSNSRCLACISQHQCLASLIRILVRSALLAGTCILSFPYICGLDQVAMHITVRLKSHTAAKAK